MNFNNIRDILAVVEHGSLRAASRHLSITQPSITRSIRNAENELGQPLFTRHTHGVTLTEMGHRFVERAKAIQSELRHIAEDAEQSEGRFTGQVSVAMSAAASLALLPAIQSRFEQDYPEALLKLSEGLLQPIEKDIFSGDVDFFVGPVYENLNTTALYVEKLFDNKRIILARNGHALAGAKTLEALRDAHWIRPSFSSTRDEADFEAMFEQAGLPLPHVVTHCRSAMMTFLAVANSDLLTILPIQWLDFVPASERLVAIDLEQNLQAAPVCIVRRSELPLTPLAERLCDITRKAGLNYGRRLAGEI